MRPAPQPWPANVAVLHGLFESVHYVIPRGLDQTASVAQLAEQLICNQQVAGSTPAASSACPASRQCRPDFSTHERTAIPEVTQFRKPPAQSLSQPEVTSTTRREPAGTHQGHPTGTQPKHPSLPLPHGGRARGEFPERSKGSDCKSDGLFLRRFESCTPHCPVCRGPVCQAPRCPPSMPTQCASAHVCSIRRSFGAGVAQW